MTRGLHYDLCLKYLVYINFSEVDFLPDRLCVVFENVHRKLKCFGVYVVLLLKGKIKKKKPLTKIYFQDQIMLVLQSVGGVALNHGTLGCRENFPWEFYCDLSVLCCPLSWIKCLQEVLHYL